MTTDEARPGRDESPRPLIGRVPDDDTLRSFNADLIAEFRANAGNVDSLVTPDRQWQHSGLLPMLPGFDGMELLLLTTTGAKSGRTRVNPLSGMRLSGKLVVMGSYFGAKSDPAWVHNLRKNPQARVEIGNESFDVTAYELQGAARKEAVAHLTAMVTNFAHYQASTPRPMPFFELLPRR